MEIERVISFFDKNSEELIGEVDISAINLELLIGIFKPPKEDPLMYYPYNINQDKGDKLSKLTNVNFDFSKYIYQLDCFQKSPRSA